MKPKINYLKIELSGKNLILRPYKFSDFKNCRHSHERRLPDVNKFDAPVSLCRESDYKKFKERVSRYRSRGKNKEHYVFGLFEKESGLHVGHIDILTINKEINWGNLGYHIQNHSYRKGYATEGCKLALRTAFEYLNFHRIEASMETANKGLKKSCSGHKSGFRRKKKKIFSGRRRNRYVGLCHQCH